MSIVTGDNLEIGPETTCIEVYYPLVAEEPVQRRGVNFYPIAKGVTDCQAHINGIRLYMEQAKKPENREEAETENRLFRVTKLVTKGGERCQLWNTVTGRIFPCCEDKLLYPGKNGFSYTTPGLAENINAAASIYDIDFLRVEQPDNQPQNKKSKFPNIFGSR